MSTDRVTAAEEKLDAALAAAQPARHLLEDDDPVRPGSTLTATMARTLFENQFASRSTDAASRRLKARGLSYYTISSAGHEQNAIVGTQLRLNDPSFLHYRSGGFMMARSSQSPDIDPVLDTMLSICGSKDDPISQGRHKVWGSHPLWVPPQTSTIASHLPKAVGMAFALGRSRRLDHDPGLPDDAIVMCSFGDASANHATALSGINAARYGLRRGNPMPILFVCEDNGIGISVETPQRWITETYSDSRYLRFFDADGEVDDVWDTVEQAIHVCRSRRVPVFLRLPTERLWGHAGSDIETAYRPAAQIRESEGRDPLILNARRLIELGAATPAQLQEIVARIRRRVDEAGEKAARRGQLTSVEAIVKPLAPYDEASARLSARGIPDAAARKALWGDDAPEFATAPVKRTMAAHLSAGLADEMLRRPETLVFGEDVGRKGGVYYVTAGLQKRFGQGRVFDTQLDETTILGLAQGAAMLGLLPIPEIQYLAYVHNAVDQIRGEAASLQFFSSGQFQNPMVIRMAGLAYQKGFGGHFHNDNSLGGLRDIPGLLIAAPSRGDEAVKLLRGCVATAATSGRVVVFLEPIALYHERDLHEDGDGRWLSDYPLPGEAILPGEVGVHAPEAPPEVLIVSYANGLRMSLQAQAILSRDHAVHAKVLDLRWLNPLPLESVRAEAEGVTAVIVADECRRTGGGIAEAVVADLAESGYPGRLSSVRAVDSFVPLGAAANLVLIQTPDIVAAVLAAIEKSPERLPPDA
ncbi:MAG: thiamine pyrophosphate-dependent enzyme [Longimicrobiales bacterium]|nr:thiamine pyrophosphate-dependent enzyme [Longimicrobiales bacterium]